MVDRYSRYFIFIVVALFFGFIPFVNVFAVVDPDSGVNPTNYSFSETLKQECASNCDFINKAIIRYFFEPNGYKITVPAADFYSGNIKVGEKYQCYYTGPLSDSTDVKYCVLLVSTPLVTPDDPSIVTTPDTGSAGDATSTEPAGEMTIGINADINSTGIDGTKCPNDAVRNKNGDLSYTRGVLAGVSCEHATKTLEDVLLIVKNIVTTLLLPAVGVLFIIMLLIGGILYISSAGNQKQVDRGKAILTAAIIGLLIVTLSYTIITIFANMLGGGIA